MNFCERRFNLYLLIPMLCALVAGCASDKKDDKIAILRLHLETTAMTPGNGEIATVMRSKPVEVNISDDQILSEANIISASIVETPGGFAMEIKFDETGTWILEHATAANPGKHFAILGQWGEKPLVKRWLAAPIISHRIANGTLSFTPDADREEVKQLVQGLNNNANNNRKGSLK